MRQTRFSLAALTSLLIVGVLIVSAFAPLASDAQRSKTPEGVLAIPTWEQVNAGGFGGVQAPEVTALESFNGYLYAGTQNPVDPAVLTDGAQIFRSANGADWIPVTQPGFGIAHDIAPAAILNFVVFNNQIYAGTGQRNASQIWRSSNGTTWAPMDVTGFGDPDNVDISALAVYSGKLYAGVMNRVTGAEIWSSFTGDNNSWTQVAPATAGTAPSRVTGFGVFSFDDGLYAAVESKAPVQIWRSYGADWEVVLSNGFGNATTLFSGGLVEFGGFLYVGAGNTTTGAQLWRTNNGADWEQVLTPGLGDPNNREVETVFVFQNQLHIGMANSVSGLELWRWSDGVLWEQINPDGFGDGNNTLTNASNATSVFGTQLYVGTKNLVDGGEVWRTVQAINHAPTDIALSNSSVNENQPVNTVVGSLSATDPDAGATFTFSLACTVPGVDNASFNLLGTDLRTSAVFDFETKSTYNICVRVTDQGGLSFDENIVIHVNDVFENNAPTDIALSNATVNENQPVNTVVGTLSATDPDAGATFTFSLSCTVPGADNASFNILGTDLRTSAVFDFETKTTYNICVRVTDQGEMSFDENFVVTVNNLAENNPPTDIALSNTTVNENQPVNTVVGSLSATDPDAGATFTFSLSCTTPGADNASFNILGTDLRTSAVFDFETKATYNICVRVTDQGGLSFDENFVIHVNDVFENNAPTDIALSNTTVNENLPVNTVVGTLSATDPDAGATFTFSLACATPGADNASFNILGTDLRTSAVFDFETKSTYNICVRVTDQGGLFFDENFVITVNNLAENNSPTDIALSNSSVNENQPLNTVVGMLSATDPDAGATFNFSLSCTTPGADNASFNILGTDLRTSAVFDFEAKSTYNICVRVTDQGGLFFDENFTIHVNDLSEGLSTPGNVKGGGAVITPRKSGFHLTFSFGVSFQAGEAAPTGHMTYQDHANKFKLKAIAFDQLVIKGNHAWFTGTGVLEDGRMVAFLVKLTDGGKPGRPDTFYIYIPGLNGYEAGGALTGGSLTIQIFEPVKTAF